MLKWLVQRYAQLPAAPRAATRHSVRLHAIPGQPQVAPAGSYAPFHAATCRAIAASRCSMVARRCSTVARRCSRPARRCLMAARRCPMAARRCSMAAVRPARLVGTGPGQLQAVPWLTRCWLLRMVAGRRLFQMFQPTLCFTAVSLWTAG